MEREYCKQDVFRCNTTGELLVFSYDLGNGEADFCNATDSVDRWFKDLTYVGRNPNIVLIEEIDPNGLYYVYGREETFKSDQRYRLHSIDKNDKCNSFKMNLENEYKFWAKVIAKIPFTSLLELGLYNPFNCESPKKSMLVDESGSLSSSNSTKSSPLIKQPKALI